MSQPTLTHDQLFSLVANEFYLPATEEETIQEIVTDSLEISKGSAWPVILILLALLG